MLPSIVGELPELSENGLLLGLYDHYKFQYGPGFAIADEGSLGH